MSSAGTLDELLQELNYDFNYFLHQIRTHSRRLDQGQRRLVEAWIDKLAHTNQTLEEVRLRNDFLFYLSSNCEQGTLQAPFDQRPPPGYVLNATHLIPTETPKTLFENSQSPQTELFRRSPDGGAFLVSQPVPRCGAFCYLAIVSKRPAQNKKKGGEQ
ncbi:uncharacterized protein LOC129760988 [Uranotaenia lowii]|uniref:uncharacterized protein LOC129760988 n=1 Tax=Uranotaenia lowii TaxID=190385 RepID=UPI00247A699F|nr:uncharacterized protein LOC129760988 [Uranotaenia lowii]